MAVLKGVKTTRKAKKPRSSKAADEYHTGPEPIWDDIDSLEDPKFRSRLFDAFYYYNYFNKVKDLKKNVVKYLQLNSKFTVEEIKIFSKSGDYLIPITVCSLATAANRGMPMEEKWHDYIVSKVQTAIDCSDIIDKEEAPTKKKGKVSKPKTIQDRLREKVDLSIAKVEEVEDRVLYDGEKRDPEIYTIFKTDNVPQAQLSRVIDTFKVREAEFVELNSKDCDPELKEAYKHYKKADIKRILAFYEKLFEGIDLYKASKKASRKTRKKKPVTKSKLVAKMKFKKEDATYKVVSIDPTEIVGAKEVWLFNTKTRKLGKLIASELEGELSVKGTTITGFDEQRSVCKTLRKPAQQLAEFKKANKVKLRKFLGEIKAVEIKLTGRTGPDTIILKAFT